MVDGLALFLPHVVPDDLAPVLGLGLRLGVLGRRPRLLLGLLVLLGLFQLVLEPRGQGGGAEDEEGEGGRGLHGVGRHLRCTWRRREKKRGRTPAGLFIPGQSTFRVNLRGCAYVCLD